MIGKISCFPAGISTLFRFRAFPSRSGISEGDRILVDRRQEIEWYCDTLCWEQPRRWHLSSDVASSDALKLSSDRRNGSCRIRGLVDAMAKREVNANLRVVDK